MSEKRIWFVPGIPEPMPRQKAFKKGDHASTYTPRGRWEEWANGVFLQFGGAPIPAHDGPCIMTMEYQMPMPASMPKKLQVPRLYCWKKPDIDNLEKLVLDVLKRRGWFRDDSRVVEVRHRKIYLDPTGLKITLEHLEIGAIAPEGL